MVAIFAILLPDEFDMLMFWSSQELFSSVIRQVGNAVRSLVDSLLPLVKDYNSLFGKFTSVFDSVNAEEALLEVAHRMATLIMAYAFDIEKDDESDEGCDGDSSALQHLPKAP